MFFNVSQYRNPTYTHTMYLIITLLDIGEGDAILGSVSSFSFSVSTVLVAGGGEDTTQSRVDHPDDEAEEPRPLSIMDFVM